MVSGAASTSPVHRAFELAFAPPMTGKPLRFAMPLPADMARLLVLLRR
jgi:hypothetical protein